MVKWCTILAGIVIIGIGSWFIFRGAPVPLVNAPPAGSTIVVFGDSLVAGVGGDEPGGFVTKLEERLGLPIINAGQAGDTTEDALDRLPSVLAYDPDIVLILFGGNDALRRTDPTVTFANLRTIITTFQENGAVVYVLGIRGGFLARQYKREFSAIASEMGVLYQPDVLAETFGRPALMSDTVHPNEAGYALIADQLEPKLRQLLDTCVICSSLR